MRRLLVAALFVLASGRAVAHDLPVDVELVLAVDVSGSIDAAEAALPREGYLSAIVHREVIDAIRGGPFGRIALVCMEWAGEHYQQVVVDWRLVEDAASAGAFADALAIQPRRTERWTSISAAIDAAAARFDGNGFEGTRRVIDLSADGHNNSGRAVTAARDEAVARGVTINGLPILNDRPGPGGWPAAVDLDRYFEENVIGGPGAFMVPAEDFDVFAVAIRTKLVREIALRDAAATGATAALR
ncbi:MAG: DUF1194 domain-containing protein [Alphaproteobacteria bacterium]